MHTTRNRPLARLATTLIAMTAMVGGSLLVAPPAAASIVFSPEIQGVVYSADNANIPGGATAISYDATDGPIANIQPSVTIAGTQYAVKTIGPGAFANRSLTSVSIPTGVTTIGSQAFANNSLSSVTLPSTVTSIGTYALYDNDLTSIALPTGLTTISDAAFYNNDLTSVTIPNSVTSIGLDAFNGNAIASASLSTNLTTIGDRAFFSNALTTVTVPGSGATIGKYAFGQNDLTSATLLSGVAAIDEGAFMQNQLTSLSIPSSVTTIGKDAFRGNQLATATLPQGVVHVGEGAFQENRLTSVTIPASVTDIGPRAFEFNNFLLETVHMLGDAPTVWPAGVDESFDSSRAGFLVHYNSSMDGWTTPTWQGYATMKELKASITGIAREKYVLTAVPNQTPPDSINLAYQWYADGVAISGATTETITLAKAQAARRVTVKITATSTGGGAYSETATSASTAVVSSLYKRIVRSAYTIPHGKGLTVTATGFGNRRYVRILMNNVVRYTGRSDSLGTVRKYVTFKSGTKAGARSVKVQYKSSNGKWYTGISTTVNYK